MSDRDSVTRREFLARACAAGAGLCFAGIPAVECVASAGVSSGWREARYYKRLPGGKVHCFLCPCNPFMKVCGVLDEGETCYCRVRTNRDGRFYVTNYGRACAVHSDPVEKGPLYHVMPGAKVLAVAAPGCNLACKCCQNWEMSQAGVEDTHTFDAPPRELVRRAMEAGCRGMAFTYTEPVIYFEYLVDTAQLARKQGLRNFVSTGGYITTEPLVELCKYVDGFSVSVKGFTEGFYLDYCRGSLKVVQDALKTIRAQGVWLEIPVLIIPTLSDDMDQVAWFCSWVKKNLGADVPIHFIRFTPMYLLRNLPTTPVSVLERARKVALEAGLRYAYIGNVPGHDANNTDCPACGRLLIQRIGLKVLRNRLASNTCPDCGYRIPGLWA